MNKFNDEMQNKNFYQQTFNEIHASPELLGKVNDMKNTNKIKKVSRTGYSLAATLALCFIFSNIVTYAATGSAWITKAIVRINGEEKPVDLVHTQDENGNDMYTATFDAEDSEDDLTIEMENGLEPVSEIQLPEIKTSLAKEGGKIYFLANDLKIDITEDFTDGTCSGTFTLDGMEYSYHITGNADEYNIFLSTSE